MTFSECHQLPLSDSLLRIQLNKAKKKGAQGALVRKQSEWIQYLLAGCFASLGKKPRPIFELDSFER